MPIPTPGTAARCLVLLAAGGAVTACPQPPPAAPVPPDPPPAAEEPAAARCEPPAIAAAPCVLSGDDVRLVDLEIRPEASPSFRLHARGVSAEVAPGASPGCWAVQVRGRLDFSATTENVPLRPAGGPLEAADGVALGADARLDRVSFADGLLTGDGSLGMGVGVRPVRLACAALAIDVPNRVPQTRPVTEPNTPVWLPAGPTLGLSRSAEEPASLTVVVDDPYLAPFVERERRGDRLHLALEFDDGGRIAGWADLAELTAAAAPGYGDGLDGGELGNGGRGGCGGTRLYCGPADVAEGAPVYSEAGSGPWATVRDGRAFEVRAVKDEPWVQLRDVPGLEDADGQGDLPHAWVPAEAVTLPPGAFPAPPTAQ